MTIKAALNQLKAERKHLEGQLKRVDAAIVGLASLNGHSAKGKGKLSAAGRARIVAAQKKRWAKIKAKE